MKRVAVLVFLLAFLITTGGTLSLASDNPAPDFELTDLTGKSISLSDLRGKVIFVNFWATWCGPCRQEIPDFIEFYKENKDNGAVILGVSVDKSTNKVRDFASDYGINYPIAMATDAIVKDYKPGKFVPTTIIIDSNGMIQQKQIGVMDKSALEHYFKEYSGK
jgi:peroxiredoxin